MKPLTIIVLFLLSFNSYAKVRYVKSPPMKSFVKTTVLSCGQRKTIQVPLITWGGDIPTIYANGNQVRTTSKSLFAKKKLNLKLVREDVFSKQVENLITCKSPFLRGTMGMINLAKDVTDLDPRTKLKVVYQMTWSAGGDALVVKGHIKSAKDLKGKTIAVQAYGPHVDYLAKILSNAGLTVKDVKIKWTKDLTGTQNTPVEAFRDSKVDAAMVIIPDANALSSNGSVGNGSEDSVKGARILLSTKTSNRVIADVYAVRTDFFEANRAFVSDFVYSLLKAQEEVASVMRKDKSADYIKLMKSSAEILLDSAAAVGDAKGMYLDAEFVGYPGNEQFFMNSKYPRSFNNLTQEIQKAFVGLGLLASPSKLDWAKWDFKTLKSGLKHVVAKKTPKFNPQRVRQIITNKLATKTLDDDVLFGIAAYFAPKQSTVPTKKYLKEFDKIIDLVATNGGAILTVEGHTDPSYFQRRLEKNALTIELNKIRQATKNLSKRRANAFRDSLIIYAKTRGVTIDDSQVTTIGHGVNNPKFARPKNRQQWAENRRVEFRMINVETETDIFVPFK